MSAFNPLERNRHPVARLWWWLLPSTSFFAYPDATTWPERIKWGGPYLLWKLVNKLPVSPYPPLPTIVCNCDYCLGLSDVFEP